MTRADLFDKNAMIVRDLVEVIAHIAPKAALCICTNPVNALIPLAAEILREKGVYNKDRLFGVTLLDNMRACHFFNNAISQGGDLWDSTSIVPVKEVPVIGGHSEDSIVPLFSVVGSRAFGLLNEQSQRDLYTQVREAGSTVVKAKAGRGSATLSMGVANAYFVVAIADALLGRKRPTICTMIDTAGYADVPFMAWPVRLNEAGIDSRLRLPKISPHEAKLLDEALPILRKDADKGKKWLKDHPDLWSPAAGAAGEGADAPRWNGHGAPPKGYDTFSSKKIAKLEAKQSKL